MAIKTSKAIEDILKCFDVLKELRSDLQRKNFVSMVEEIITEGYILAFIGEGNRAVAAVILDSGYCRTAAHQLYLNKVFTLNSHHFSKKI